MNADDSLTPADSSAFPSDAGLPPAIPIVESSVENDESAPPDSFLHKSLPPWGAPLIFLLLGTIFFWKSLFGGDVFLPATLLGSFSPWKQTGLYPVLPPWNPLRWDGIGQFYPWRHFAAESIRSGVIPLWNPYQFGGTPFVANSQSAVLYPGNILFALIPETSRAFAWSALLHTTLCGWFTYLFLRRLPLPISIAMPGKPNARPVGCSELSAVLGGIVFTYSFWQVAWMQLPSFLATSCWLPLVLRQITLILSANSSDKSRDSQLRRNPLFGDSGDIALLAGAIGMMLLAGHLQIAFYALFAALLWGLCSLCFLSSEPSRWKLRRAGVCLAGFCLGLALALPQLLPSIELSRMSHRVSKPSAEGYQAYVEYALPLSGLSLLTLPETFGGDSDPANPYWGYYEKRLPDGNAVGIRHNLAETAIYVGILPLFLASIVVLRLKSSPMSKPGFDSVGLFFLLLALLASLMALGTPANALFYFGIPGFGQSGSPARCLVLWAFALACLSALGLESLLRRKLSRRETAFACGSLLIWLILGIALVSRSVASPPLGLKSLPSMVEILSRNVTGLIRCFLIGGIATLGSLSLRSEKGGEDKAKSATRFKFGASAFQIFACLLAVSDLFWTGMGVNPTAKPEQVYPMTKGIDYLQKETGHGRVAPLNQLWGLYSAPPDVMPPNSGMVYHLRDLQGYDSLFLGKYKAFANGFARPNRMGALDSSPPEVGNMVFIQNGSLPGIGELGVKFAISVPYGDTGFAEEGLPSGAPLDTGDSGMGVYPVKNAEPRAFFTPSSPSSSKIFPDSPNDYRLEWLEDSPTRVTFGITPLASGEFTLRDPAAPGWKALFDGKPIDISSEGDLFTRKVSLPEGVDSSRRHMLSFRYDPASFRLGLYCSLFSCLVLYFIVISNRILRRSALRN